MHDLRQRSGLIRSPMVALLYCILCVRRRESSKGHVADALADSDTDTEYIYILIGAIILLFVPAVCGEGWLSVAFFPYFLYVSHFA